MIFYIGFCSTSLSPGGLDTIVTSCCRGPNFEPHPHDDQKFFHSEKILGPNSTERIKPYILAYSQLFLTPSSLISSGLRNKSCSHQFLEKLDTFCEIPRGSEVPHLIQCLDSSFIPSTFWRNSSTM